MGAITIIKNQNNMKEKNQTLEDAFKSRNAKEKEKVSKIKDLTSEQRAVYIKRFGEDKMKEFEKQASGRKLIFLKVDDSLAVLRPPTAEDLGDYMMCVAESGMAKAGIMIVQALWLDGDLDLINDEDKWLTVFLQMSNLLEGKKGEFFRG